MWITLKNEEKQNRTGQYGRNNNYVNTRECAGINFMERIKNGCSLNIYFIEICHGAG